MTVEFSPLTSQPAKHGVDDVLVARVTGEVDILTAPHLQQALDETLERMTGGRVVLDLTAVSFFGSPGLAVLAAAAAQADQHHCALRIVVGTGEGAPTCWRCWPEPALPALHHPRPRVRLHLPVVPPDIRARVKDPYRRR
jgi:anti-anti-sigma factor